ncbi:MAG: hypothetical protein K2J65_10920 [Duncaniella sp.]|nr:hypothetical protein [Duncaniella sp.]
MDNSRFRKVIQYLKENKYIRNQQDFVERVDSDKATVSQIMNDKAKIPNSVFAGIKEAFPFISIEWIKGDDTEMILTSKLTRNFNVDMLDASLVPLVPITALANPLGEYIGGGVRKEDCQFIVTSVSGAELAIIISGDSMEPKFHDGTIVYLKRINDAAFIPWGNTLVLDTENGAFIKNVYPFDDYTIEARSINPLYPSMHIPKTSIFGMYRVLSSTKFFTTM